MEWQKLNVYESNTKFVVMFQMHILAKYRVFTE